MLGVAVVTRKKSGHGRHLGSRLKNFSGRDPNFFRDPIRSQPIDSLARPKGSVLSDL